MPDARRDRVGFPSEARHVDRLVQAAVASFDAEWDRPTFDPAELLDAIATEIEASGDELTHCADEETGLGAARLAQELTRTTHQLRAFASVVREGGYLEPILDVPASDSGCIVDVRRMNVPIGPVAVWAASNFPLAFSVAGGDTASAFAAGCPVVVKAHPGHPRTSDLTARAVEAAMRRSGAPRGWFSLLHASDHRVGVELATHPGIRAIAFTGSVRGGRALHDAAAARPDPIPVFAEMGSLNPVILTESALAERGEEIARGLAASLTASAGQLCTKPGLVLVVDSPVATDFLGVLSRVVQDQSTTRMLYPALAETFRESVAATVTVEGVDVLVSAPVEPTELQNAWIVRVSGATFLASQKELAEERFGPFVMIVVCADGSELERVLDVLSGTLTATLHSTLGDAPRVARLVRRLASRAGRIVHNGWPTGVQVGWATVHGGPYPATTSSSSTSVGMTAARRFQRPVAYQAVPEEFLPVPLRNANTLGILRLVNGRHTTSAIPCISCAR